MAVVEEMDRVFSGKLISGIGGSFHQNMHQDRDSFLMKACKSANIPLIQYKAKSKYNISHIRESVLNN